MLGLDIGLVFSINGYYTPDEDLFLEKTGLTIEEVFPYKRMSNSPLDYHENGLYEINPFKKYTLVGGIKLQNMSILKNLT
jgi:hypothetical protein